MQKGKTLKFGDTIGLIAPASPTNKDRTFKAIETIEHLGFRVIVGDSCFQVLGGYLAGTPKSRASELNSMFKDDEVDAILCLRGGYGTPQILTYLDYEMIAENPKLFIGYSDITALHIALMQKSHLATIHGPMAASDLIDADDFTKQALLRTVIDSRPLGKLENPNKENMCSLVAGEATGEIVGGNLSLICALLGTPYELDTTGKLLFLEEIDEEPYKVDRMLTQLMLAGKLTDAAGIILGSWTNCEGKAYPNGFTLMDVFKNIFIPINKPTIYNVFAGHCETKLTLPLGVKARVDATMKQLIIEESITCN
ncbi:LD-carboxypeptidase [Heyndrickxia sporothermodurans]|uniref:LD-carboxypeptidase n=1 Tax=Heyndrickxia sporothermodurans TaxID=46224 RepID=A0A150L858_9BACI|nr:LD-carboxypeptidase [Heyndrickxia sporothermodurans]KYD07902.1 Muramoyltetrapeptide carboxypeptidase [Heyndrickxia sporothermodurans]MBL5768640.1 LD-carboxypeptidase [Heyndrickxia sporothermodurans]MBL5770158.1 LD-carboxypeptidase [Heyndrickxia sporothermodurans]MBL5773794.1 LD-carboxypeptidase [Heyndrickxia sporothermodurans]MBL5777152.1 LD-carboxypeptidase [Heyndrickxia sporothermodurans]